jgi:hypothetical protein
MRKTIHRPGVIDRGSESGMVISLRREPWLPEIRWAQVVVQSSTKQSWAGRVSRFSQSLLVVAEDEKENAQLLCNQQKSGTAGRSSSVATWIRGCHNRAYCFSVFSKRTAYRSLSSPTTVSARGWLSPDVPPSTPRMLRPERSRPPSSRSGNWQKLSASHTDIYSIKKSSVSGKADGNCGRTDSSPPCSSISVASHSPSHWSRPSIYTCVPCNSRLRSDQKVKFTYG